MERCTCGHEVEQLGLGYAFCDAECHGSGGRWWVDRGTMQTGINSEAHTLAPLALVYKRDKEAAEARLKEAERLLVANLEAMESAIKALPSTSSLNDKISHFLELACGDIRAFLEGER